MTWFTAWLHRRRVRRQVRRWLRNVERASQRWAAASRSVSPAEWADATNRARGGADRGWH